MLVIKFHFSSAIRSWIGYLLLILFSNCVLLGVVWKPKIGLASIWSSSIWKGLSLFERSRKHLDNAADLKKCRHIVKHLALKHPDGAQQPVFKFRVLRQHKVVLYRRIYEDVWIGTHGTLNFKSEFLQNQKETVCQSNGSGNQSPGKRDWEGWSWGECSDWYLV